MKKIFLTLLIFGSICSSNVFAINPDELALIHHKKACQFVKEGGNPEELTICGKLEDVFNDTLSILYDLKDPNILILMTEEILKETLNDSPEYFFYAVIKNKISYVQACLNIFINKQNLSKARSYALELHDAGIDRTEIIEILSNSFDKN